MTPKPKNSARPLILSLLAAFALAPLAGCVSQNPNAPGGPQTSAAMPAQPHGSKIKVGILLPLSGPHQALGNAMLNAAQMALFDIGYGEMELVPRDTAGDPAAAAQAARAVLSEGAQIILGPVFAAEVRAVKPVTQSANANMIAFSTDWTLAGGNTFTMGFLPFDQVERLSAFAASRGVSRVGVLAPQNEYGRAVSGAFNAAAAQKNLSVTASVGFNENGTNLIPAVGQIAATAPQAVLMPVGGTQASQIAAQLSASRLPPATVRRLGTGLFDDPALARDPNLQGAWFAAPPPAQRQRFEQRYQASYGQQAPRLSTLAYDATALAAILARRGMDGPARRPAFDRASLTNSDGFSGIDGIFRFRADGRAERGLAVLEYQNGQIRVIDEAPRSFAPPAVN